MRVASVPIVRTLIDGKPAKTCTGCHTIKSLDDFYSDAGRPDGRSYRCRVCLNEARYKSGTPGLVRRAENERLLKRGMFLCSRCVTPKTLDSFPVGKGGRRRPWCTDCQKTRGMYYRYGMSRDTYDSLSLAQGGVCFVCKQPPTEANKLRIDHDHTTGRIRKLLCHNCNISLGLLREDEQRIRALADYISMFAACKREG